MWGKFSLRLSNIILVIIIFLFTEKTYCMKLENEQQFNKLMQTLKEMAANGAYINVNVINNQNAQHNSFNFDSWKKTCSDSYNSSKDKFGKSFNSLSEYINQNKTLVCKYLIGAAYLTIHARFFYLKYKLSNNNNWSYWQNTKSLHELFEIPQNSFSEKLLIEAQRKYATIDNLTSFSQPLNKLMHDINIEEIYLKEYQKIVTWINRLFLGKFFFFDNQFFLTIPDRLTRLAYIKNTFLNWLAQYKAINAKDFLRD